MHAREMHTQLLDEANVNQDEVNNVSRADAAFDGSAAKGD